MATAEQVEEQSKTEEVSQSAPGKKKEGSFGAMLLLFLFLLIILSIPLIFTRFNVLGAGEKLRPYLSSNSVLKYILPVSKNPEELKTLNRNELIALGTEQKAKIALLEKKLKNLEEVSEIYTGSSDGFQRIDADRADVAAQRDQINKDKEQLKKDKETFYEQVKNGNKAAFKEYYEKIDSETAKKLYAEILKEQKVLNDIQQFVEYYQKMDAASAAKIFEQLSMSKIELVADILKNMDKGKASKIIQSMDVKVAGRITDILAKKSPLGR